MNPSIGIQVTNLLQSGEITNDEVLAIVSQQLPTAAKAAEITRDIDTGKIISIKVNFANGTTNAGIENAAGQIANNPGVGKLVLTSGALVIADVENTTGDVDTSAAIITLNTFDTITASVETSLASYANNGGATPIFTDGSVDPVPSNSVFGVGMFLAFEESVTWAIGKKITVTYDGAQTIDITTSTKISVNEASFSAIVDTDGKMHVLVADAGLVEFDDVAVPNAINRTVAEALASDAL